tara:strand:+ start:851 stop:2452 length:1602 start_codon:yes stop_codon:yes gene_type:complete
MIIFVADAFAEHYGGGAELTTEALIDSKLLPGVKVLSETLTKEAMEENKDGKFWVFANFANLSQECLVYAIKNLNYCVLEYDYKYCSYRSPGKHAEAEGSCDCGDKTRAKLVAMFLKSAKINWWMSEKQMEKYKSEFPFVEGKVLSSVFSKQTLDYIESLDTSSKNEKWIILNSNSWIKGVEDSVNYAKENNLDYELVWGLEYEELLAKLASSKGLIFLPKAGDTCPRLVVEAKLLDCQLVLNENVQHKDEGWFTDKQSIFKYLRERTSVFWREVDNHIDFLPSKTLNEGNKYYIITPFYNAEDYLHICIESIKKQKYENFHCILVDDMSTDRSHELAEQVIDGDPRFTLIKNTEKKYALANIVDAIDSSDSSNEDVIILLDGDDWLSSTNTLGCLNRYYSEGSWLTYGSYIYHPWGAKGVEPSVYPDQVVENNAYRSDSWRASHLRTFRKDLWDRIDKKDLKDTDGKFYEMTYDQAIMLPLLEMAGRKATYVPEVLHVYNKENPLNVDKIKTEKQVALAREIRSKKQYERIE